MVWFKKKEIPVSTEEERCKVQRPESAKEEMREMKETQEIDEEEEEEVVNEVAWLKSMLSHNVRMPLSIVYGYAELLQDGMIEGVQKQKECLDKICQNITYLSHVVSLVVDGNAQEGLSYNMEQMDLVECIGEVVGYMKDVGKKRGIILQFNCPQKKIMMQGDYVHLMRIIFGLTENSFKYMRKKGQITIVANTIDDEEILLVYRDDGRGMEKEEAEHIFESGFRGSNKKNAYGSGMGMSYVKEVVEKHGGSVEAISAPDKGMSIFIKLPRRES